MFEMGELSARGVISSIGTLPASGPEIRTTATFWIGSLTISVTGWKLNRFLWCWIPDSISLVTIPTWCNFIGHPTDILRLIPYIFFRRCSYLEEFLRSLKAKNLAKYRLERHRLSKRSLNLKVSSFSSSLLYFGFLIFGTYMLALPHVGQYLGSTLLSSTHLYPHFKHIHSGKASHRIAFRGFVFAF